MIQREDKPLLLMLACGWTSENERLTESEMSEGRVCSRHSLQYSYADMSICVHVWLLHIIFVGRAYKYVWWLYQWRSLSLSLSFFLSISVYVWEKY